MELELGFLMPSLVQWLLRIPTTLHSCHRKYSSDSGEVIDEVLESQ